MKSAWACVVAVLLAAFIPAMGQEKSELVGSPAIDFKADFAVNGKPVRLADLKGKVVLLDFWAVWCGPCIRSFPHLRELNEQYRDKGLEIVGLTSYYEKVGFDKEAGKIKILKEKLSAVEEQEMLKAFATHHKLDYRLLAIPAEESKEVYTKYGIKGIPTVVLIDRQGVVRLFKVGASEENDKAIAEMVKKLLAE